MTQYDLLLEKFTKIDWSEEKQQLKNSELHKFPFLPLDIRIPKADRKIIREQLELANSKKWHYCDSDTPQPGADKLWFYGIKDNNEKNNIVDDYKKWWHLSSSNKIKNFDDLQETLSDYDFDWKIKVKEIQNFIDQFPKKKLYNLEGINYEPNGKSYVHWDREHFFKTHGDRLYGRLYIPIEWEDDATLYWYGFGKVPIESGRVYIINTMQIHGSHNNSNSHRYAMHFMIDPRVQEYYDLLHSSKIKFLKTF